VTSQIAVFEAVIRVKAIYSVSQKNVTNLMLNNLTNSNRFQYFCTEALLLITIIFSYWTSCEFTLPCNISQWHKWRVAITSSVPQSVIWQSRCSAAYPAACMC